MHHSPRSTYEATQSLESGNDLLFRMFPVHWYPYLLWIPMDYPESLEPRSPMESKLAESFQLIGHRAWVSSR